MELSEASQRLRDTREMSLYSVDLIHTTPLLSLKKSAIRFHFIGFTQLVVPSPMIQDRVMRSPERTVGLLVTEKHTRTCPLVSQLRHLTVEIFLYFDKIMLEYCHSVIYTVCIPPIQIQPFLS